MKADYDRLVDELPSKEKLLRMLVMEETIRMSKKYIDKCTELKDEINGWIRLSGEIQELVAYSFGYKDIITNMLAVSRYRLYNN